MIVRRIADSNYIEESFELQHPFSGLAWGYKVSLNISVAILEINEHATIINIEVIISYLKPESIMSLKFELFFSLVSDPAYSHF